MQLTVTGTPINNQNFGLGITLTATITPLEVAGGYRFKLPGSPRLVPYVGAGVGSYGYNETSEFSDASENVDTRHTGYLAVGGAEFRLHRWIGVSVEDSRVLPRVDDLRKVPAAVRFLSCEPLIGSLASIDLTDIHWVIVGGESGPFARPMNIQWVREIFRACRKQRVPFFFKQWGGVRKDLTGRTLGGRTYDEMPARVCVCASEVQFAA